MTSPVPGHPAKRWGIGYTAGVFDLFHVGHLNLLRHARERCSFLIVGITSDELAEASKGTPPHAPMLERMAIVQHIRGVDHVLPQTAIDKLVAWRVLQFDVVFAGDNVRGTDCWRSTEASMERVGVDVCYLPATYARSGELLARGFTDLVSE